MFSGAFYKQRLPWAFGMDRRTHEYMEYDHPPMHKRVCVLIFHKNHGCDQLSLSLLSGVPDLWDRNKILSVGDLSHYQVPHCIRVFF